jgi:hypothetical protein
MSEWNYLEGNAYHEAGHAIVGLALGLGVVKIKVRDDRPGEHADMEGDVESLPLVDRVTAASWQRPLRHSSSMSAVEGKPAVPSRSRDFSF